MNKKNIFFLLLFFNLNFHWQAQNNKLIDEMEINIYGTLNGKKYENISINNKTEIILYEKPFDLGGNPNLFQQKATLIPNKIIPSIKEIQYIEPEITTIPKKFPIVLNYNFQSWHEVKITFTNNEKKNYLLPASSKIIMTESSLKMQSNIDLSRLTGTGLIIEGKKTNIKKNIEQKISNT
jgi:hypothetical protein